MDLGLYMVGEAAKRGLVARLPSGQRLMGDAGDWLTGEVPDLVRSVRLDRNGEDAASLFVDIHPAALPLRLHASNAGAVDAMAVTSAAGPGYHTYLQRLIQRIELDLTGLAHNLQGWFWQHTRNQHPRFHPAPPLSPRRKARGILHLFFESVHLQTLGFDQYPP